MWVRNAEGAFIQAIRAQPAHGADVPQRGDKRSPTSSGPRPRQRRRPAERQRIFDARRPAERAHDFAMLGAAVVVDLDRVEG